MPPLLRIRGPELVLAAVSAVDGPVAIDPFAHERPSPYYCTARARTCPTNNVSVAEAVTREAVSAFEAPFSRALAVKMASVVVVLTLSGREVPSTA